MPNRMEEVASKGLGAMKSAKATIEGLTGVFKQLAHEHGEVSALLMRVKMSSSAEVRSELFPKIRRELLAHEQGELREVYPKFAEQPELQDMARDHQREASELQALLDELKVMPYEGEAWGKKFSQLVELVSHHVKEEENHYFPKASRIFGKEVTEQMKTRYEAVKAEAMGQIG